MQVCCSVGIWRPRACSTQSDLRAKAPAAGETQGKDVTQGEDLLNLRAIADSRFPMLLVLITEYHVY